MIAALFARLGLVPSGDERDTAFVVALEAALARKTVAIDRFFFDWRGGRRRGPSPVDTAYADDAFAEVARLIGSFSALPGATRHPYWSDDAPCSMLINEVEEIWRRIDDADDWSALARKIEQVRRMGEALGPS